MKLRRPLLSLLRIAAAVYLLACLLLWLFQGRLVWFPSPLPDVTPQAFGLPYEEVARKSSDGVDLFGWFVPAPQERVAILFCHGNGGTIAGRVDAAAALSALGASTLLFDYRGYGRSSGRPGEEGTYLDAEAAFDWLRNRTRAPIVAFGESLGGAVAIELARRRPLAALVTESTFTSLPDVGAEHYRLFPVRWLARIRYDSLAKVADVRCPWLLLHSRGDELVPFSHAERLLAAASAAARAAGRPAPRLVELRGGHNGGGFLAAPAALAELRTLFDEVARAR